MNMENTRKKWQHSLRCGLIKGWSGYLWMLKIIVPISLGTSLLTWSGWLNRLDFILEPAMGVIGLPPMAALPLFVGLLTGTYGAIAAMAPLPLTVDQMTLLAIFLLISHSLLQEGVVQDQSGLSFWKATLIRLTASTLTVMAVSPFVQPATASAAAEYTMIADHTPLLEMLQSWGLGTLVLAAKILVIIIPLMIFLEIIKNGRLTKGIVGLLGPVLKTLGLGRQTGFLWLTAAIFGLTYGAAVIVEEVKEGKIDRDQLTRLQLSIGINHAMIEDTLVFMSLGLGLWWMCLPRVAAAIITVQAFLLFRRLAALPGCTTLKQSPK